MRMKRQEGGQWEKSVTDVGTEKDTVGDGGRRGGKEVMRIKNTVTPTVTVCVCVCLYIGAGGPDRTSLRRQSYIVHVTIE